MIGNKHKMTVTPPTTGKAESDPTKNGANNADTNTNMKTKSEANKENRNRRKQRETERKKDNNINNYVKFDELITKGVMKGVTISPSFKCNNDIRL